MTVARYAHQSHVMMYVISPRQALFGSEAVKFRLLRSGAFTFSTPGDRADLPRLEVAPLQSRGAHMSR